MTTLFLFSHYLSHTECLSLLLCIWTKQTLQKPLCFLFSYSLLGRQTWRRVYSPHSPYSNLHIVPLLLPRRSSIWTRVFASSSSPVYLLTWIESMGRDFLLLGTLILLLSGFVSSAPSANSPASKSPLIPFSISSSHISKSLPFRRDYQWVHLKSRLVTHEMDMVTQIHHHQNKFVLPFPIIKSLPLLFLMGWFLCIWIFPAIATRSMVKFEDGYSVETVFDGSKLGIEPYSVEVLPNGELLVLDSENSNIYKISSSLSLCKYQTFKVTILSKFEISMWMKRWLFFVFT